MSLSRIKALLLQEFYITKRSLEVIIDLFLFSIMTTIMFGFVSLFLAKQTSSPTIQYLFLGILLMEIMRIAQYSTSISTLWNIWSRNLSNMFVSPLSVKEFIFASFISASVKSTITFTLISILAAYLFHFNILNLGIINLVLFVLNLLIFSLSLGIFILGFIFRFGTRIQALAWGVIFLIQPLTAAFFPVSILPSPLQKISSLLPPTHIFEAARHSLTNPSTDWQLILIAFIQNIIYFVLSLWFFKVMFKKSKESGQFARNEG